MPPPMLRLPSFAVRSWASKTVAPILGIKTRGGSHCAEGFPPASRPCSVNATVKRKSFVLEHSDSKNIEDIYDVMTEKELGAGGFGTVRQASLKGAEGVARAVKAVRRSNLKAEEVVRREIAILKHLDHPCVCRLIETFVDKHHIYLVLELIDGRELFDEITLQGTLDERLAAGIMQQVFAALKYCHEQKVIHRDLKPENIMVRQSEKNSSRVPEVVLIDFGMAVAYDGCCVTGAGGSSVMGTNDYTAPEAMKGRCSPASDIWSAGMVLHAMLFGRLPSPAEICGNDPITSGAASEDVSPAAREVVQQALLLDPSRRPTAAQAVEHAWTRGSASSPLRRKQVNTMMKNFTCFHRSVKLRRAALTALAMQLTNQQLSDHRDQFIAIDSDGNGRISKQELIDSISATSLSLLATQDIRNWAESVFDSIDTDGSQEIDYTEWLAAAVHESTRRSEQSMRDAFRVFDVDGDGRIDEGEFARVLMQTPQDIATLLPQFDTNGDGVIDFEEFKNLLNVGVVEAAGQPSIPRGLTGTSSISSDAAGFRALRESHQSPRAARMGAQFSGCMPLSPVENATLRLSL